MYYEILKKAYDNSIILQEKTIKIIDLLDEFIRSETKHGFEYFHPYKFSMFYNMSTKESIQIFLSLTDPGKLFKLTTFVDCPQCVGQRLNFNDDSLDGMIYCEECRKDYLKENLKERIYVYFSLNDNIHIPIEKLSFSIYNPNSTFDIINSMSNDLKKDSPLSSSTKANELLAVENDSFEDKGQINTRISFNEIEKYNINNGESISSSVRQLRIKMNQRNIS